MLKILKASSILIGTIIGVGVFGLPYVAAQSGVWLTVGYLIILGAMATIIHYFYGQIVIISQRQERLVGYVKEYLDSRYYSIARVTVVLSRMGALLAYIIVAGHFIEALFSLDNFYGSLIFFILSALVVFWGLKTISWLELLMSIFLVLAMLLIFIISFPHVQSINLSLPISNFFLPYGVVLFALGGAVAIPEMAEMLRNNKKKLNISILLGNILPVILFIIFTIIVVGVTGLETSPEALIGLDQKIGNGIIKLGLLFGVIALFTSFISIGLNVKKVFWYDFKLNKHLSWLIACGVPVLVFILGMRNFIETIGFIGAVFGAINAIFIILIYKKVKKKFILPAILIIIFALGIIYEIYRGFAFAF